MRHGRALARELGVHVPYALFATALGMMLIGALDYVSVSAVARHRVEGMKSLFHVFHPVHLFLSATATTAMFWKYERRLTRAVLVGMAGSVGLCSLSDIAFPFFGGLLAGADMGFHVCILEDPAGIMLFAVAGVIAGTVGADSVANLTVFSHSAHVLVSTMASLCYLIGFGLGDWVDRIGYVFLVTVIAVLVPCCTSDIVFPLACVSRAGAERRP